MRKYYLSISSLLFFVGLFCIWFSSRSSFAINANLPYSSTFLTICSAIAILFNCVPSKNKLTIDYLYQDLLRQGRIKAHTHNTNVSSKNCEECKLAEINIPTIFRPQKRRLLAKNVTHLSIGKH